MADNDGAPSSGPDDRQQMNRSRALLKSLSAIATGDADREEVVASLRREGVDALDVLVALATRNTQSSRPPGERIDVQNFVTNSVPSAPATPHPIPNQPFLLRGTLYDPPDISRFDDTELHFVHTGKEHLLAIDDRSIMENWWQTSYLTCETRPSSVPSVGGKRPTGDGFIDPYTTYPPGGGGTDNLGPTKHYIPYGHYETVPAPAPATHTNFYEHPNFQGDSFTLWPSQGAISDLSDDWNDVIDSIEMVRTEVTVLYEHNDFLGRSFTTTHTVGEVGWFNDLTSSVRTWGQTPWNETMRMFVQDGVQSVIY